MRLAVALLAVCGGLAEAQVSLPPFARQVLPNGVTVYLMPRHDVPLVTLYAATRGGAESDPDGKSGVASVTVELIRRGTTSRTGDQFADEVDALGANFETRVDPQSTRLEMEVLSRGLPRALDLFSAAILNPSFPAEEVSKLLARHVDAAKAVKDNPQAAANLYFRTALFGPSHPYGRPADEMTLSRITREDIVSYHKRIYAGRNLIVAAVGDFDPATFGPQLAKVFGAAPPGYAYRWVKDTPPARGRQPQLVLVDKPDATQTYFLVAQPGITHTDPDWVKLWIVNTLFGGRFTSMLNDELRVNSGLTYGARSLLDRDRMTGAIAITTYTRTESTELTMDLALSLLHRLRDKGISAGQLASAKAYLKGIYPTGNVETSAQLATKLIEMELYGLDRGDVDDLFARIDAVTLEQANEAIRKYYRTDGLTFVLLGNAAKIRETARKYAPHMTVVPVTRPGFQLPTE